MNTPLSQVEDRVEVQRRRTKEFEVGMNDQRLLADQGETPEDVATLYSWANLHGAKYRDFSSSRAQAREEARLRVEEAQAIERKRLAEEAERRAQEEAQIAARLAAEAAEAARQAEAERLAEIARQADAERQAVLAAQEAQRLAAQQRAWQPPAPDASSSEFVPSFIAGSPTYATDVPPSALAIDTEYANSQGLTSGGPSKDSSRESSHDPLRDSAHDPVREMPRNPFSDPFLAPFLRSSDTDTPDAYSDPALHSVQPSAQYAGKTSSSGFMNSGFAAPWPPATGSTDASYPYPEPRRDPFSPEFSLSPLPQTSQPASSPSYLASPLMGNPMGSPMGSSANPPQARSGNEGNRPFSSNMQQNPQPNSQPNSQPNFEPRPVPPTSNEASRYQPDPFQAPNYQAQPYHPQQFQGSSNQLPASQLASPSVQAQTGSGSSPQAAPYQFRDQQTGLQAPSFQGPSGQTSGQAPGQAPVYPPSQTDPYSPSPWRQPAARDVEREALAYQQNQPDRQNEQHQQKNQPGQKDRQGQKEQLGQYDQREAISRPAWLAPEFSPAASQAQPANPPSLRPAAPSAAAPPAAVQAQYSAGTMPSSIPLNQPQSSNPIQPYQPQAPAYLAQPAAVQPHPAASQQNFPASNQNPYPNPIDDTLQGSRERIANRWYALKSVFDHQAAAEQAPVQPPARVPALAIFSLAGGVGKTSIVAALGRALSARGERVLLVDTATYGLLPFFFGARDQRPGMLRTFNPPGVSAEAPIQLVTLDPDGHAPEAQSNSQQNSQQNLQGSDQNQDWLPQEVARYARGSSRILIDLPTASGAVTRRILKMSPIILVPVVPDMSSVVSVGAIESFFRNSVNPQNASAQGLGGQPNMPYYVLSQFDYSLPLHLDVREILREQIGDRLLPFALRRNPAISEALAEGMTVMDYAPTANVAEDYASLAGWARTLAAPANAVHRGVRWSER